MAERIEDLIEVIDKRSGQPIQIDRDSYNRYMAGERNNLEHLWAILDGPDLTMDSVDAPQDVTDAISGLEGEEYQDDPLVQGLMAAQKQLRGKQAISYDDLRALTLGQETIAAQRADITGTDLAQAVGQRAQGNAGFAGLNAYGQATRELTDQAAQQAANERVQQAQQLANINANTAGQELQARSAQYQQSANQMDWAAKRDQLINNYLNMAHDYKKGQLENRLKEGQMGLKAAYFRVDRPDSNLDLGRRLAVAGTNFAGTAAMVGADLYEPERYPVDAQADNHVNDYLESWAQNPPTTNEPSDPEYGY